MQWFNLVAKVFKADGTTVMRREVVTTVQKREIGERFVIPGLRKVGEPAGLRDGELYEVEKIGPAGELEEILPESDGWRTLE